MTWHLIANSKLDDANVQHSWMHEVLPPPFQHDAHLFTSLTRYLVDLLRIDAHLCLSRYSSDIAFSNCIRYYDFVRIIPLFLVTSYDSEMSMLKPTCTETSNVKLSYTI